MSAFARRIAWAILLVRLGLFDRLEVLRAKSINDYGSFHAAALAIRRGLDPYTPDDLQRAAHLSGLPAVHPYFYPPFLAELLQPLTHYRVLQARLLLSPTSLNCRRSLSRRWRKSTRRPSGNRCRCSMRSSCSKSN